MQFFNTVAVAVSALAAFAAAQSTSVAIYNMPDTVQVGKTSTLHTKSGNGPFTLILRRGNPLDLQNVSTITTTGTGSSFDWTPSSDLENGSDYALMIVQGEQANYTPEFTITGGKASGSTKSSASSSAAPSTSAPAGYSAAPSTMSTAAKSAAPSDCAVTQISDGQPQAPAGCTSSSAAPAATSAPAYQPAPKVTPMPGFNSAAVASAAPYVPMAGATGSPAVPSSNSTTSSLSYSVPAIPSSTGSSSGPSGAKGSSAPQSGAAHFGSSFALIAGAVAAFAFLN